MRSKWVDHRNGRDQLWLNVGSSYLVLEDFVNLDRSVWLTLSHAYPLVRRVLRRDRGAVVRQVWEARQHAMLVSHDCRKRMPCDAGTVDHILCSHFLEHLPAPAAERILDDFHRVLKPAGTVHIVLPDLRWHVNRYVGGVTDADAFMAATMLRSRHGDGRLFRVLEGLGGFGLHHQWMYDAGTAEARVTAAGFRIAANAETPSVSFRRDDPESLHIVGVKGS
jgi:predicted SAM-dependent methyltransferase